MGIKKETAREKFAQVALFLAFGTTGWWSANAILAELPTFVESSPEGKKIANLLCVAIQIGNIFPIVYKAICAWLFTDKTTRRILPAVVTACLISAAAMLALTAIFWGPRGTLTVLKQPHSVALLLFTMVCGGIGGMSNVTYWALASRYDERCIKAVSTGMTVGGLFAQAVALAQRAGANPRFSPEIYFVIVAIIQGLLLLVMIPIARLKHEDEPATSNIYDDDDDDDDLVAGGNDDDLLLPGGDMPHNTSINSIGRRISDNYANAVVSSTARRQQQQQQKKKTQNSSGSGASRGGNGLGQLLAKQTQEDVQQRRRSRTSSASGGDDDEELSLLGGSMAKVDKEIVYKGGAGLEYGCWLICFTLYGMTYALPSLLPYIVQGYGKNITNTTNNCTHAGGFDDAYYYTGMVAGAGGGGGAAAAAASLGGDLFGPVPNCTGVPAAEVSFSDAKYDEEFVATDFWGPAMNAGFGQRVGAAPWRFVSTAEGAQQQRLVDMYAGLGGYGDGNSTPSPRVTNTTDSALKDSIYLWMNVLQNVGDVGGRMSTGVYTPRSFGSLVILCVAAVGIFFLFILATIWRSQIPIWLPGNYAYVLPCICLVYYFVRGYLVTSTYVWVKRNFEGHEAEKLSSNLGFLGQLGALLSNAVMFVVVQMNLIGGPGHGP